MVLMWLCIQQLGVGTKDVATCKMKRGMMGAISRVLAQTPCVGVTVAEACKNNTTFGVSYTCTYCLIFVLEVRVHLPTRCVKFYILTSALLTFE